MRMCKRYLLHGNYIVFEKDGKQLEYKIIRKGDVNKDGLITMADLIMVIRKINGDITLTEEEKIASFIQIGYDKEALQEFDVNIITASNLTYAILKNIRNSYN